MNSKEIGEIRRHLHRERCNMQYIYGCYVNSQKEIVSSFKLSTAMMSQNEADRYFGVLRRTLSGAIGKNLIDVTFRTAQVADSPEHKMLMDLRSTALQDDELRMAFYKKIIDAVTYDDSYVIFAGCDNYDVPFKSSDDEVQKDASTEVFKYILCSVCPVKLKKPSLRYVAEDKEFHDGGAVQEVSAPEAGFLFPAFDNRATNIYNALLYSHNPKLSQQALADAVFNAPIPKPAAEQKKSFESLLSATLNEECSMEVVQTVHDQLSQCIQMHKESHVPEPLLISKEQVKVALTSCGISESSVAKFSVEFDEAFGDNAELYPKNIIDDRKFEVKTPDVSIKVNPERLDLIETRVIGGVKYIMICADENVEVNGVNINITDTTNDK